MRITYDPKKNAANIAKHGVSFEDAYHFDFATSHIMLDTRRDYGEMRWRATGFIRNRLHMLVYVETADGIRAISLRKAHIKERKIYEKEKA